MRCLWLSWACLTWASAMFCCAGCLLPYWLKGFIQATSGRSSMEDNLEFASDIGLFRRCVYPMYVEEGAVRIIEECGHYLFFSIPHIYWQVALIVLALSSTILVYLTFFIFFLGFCLDILRQPVVFRGCQVAQLFSSLLTMAALVLYTLGWTDNPEVNQLCGAQAHMFSPGRCQIGWAYVLTGAGGLLSLIAISLPCLIQPTPDVQFPPQATRYCQSTARVSSSCMMSPALDTVHEINGARPTFQPVSHRLVGSQSQLTQRKNAVMAHRLSYMPNQRRDSWTSGLQAAPSFYSLMNSNLASGSQSNIALRRPTSIIMGGTPQRLWNPQSNNYLPLPTHRLDEAPGSDSNSIFDEFVADSVA